jgi:hypothetical protein
MTTTTRKRRRVKCPGCGRKMYQLTRPNRDYMGKSWHYMCLSDNISSTLRASIRADARAD